MKPYQIEKCRKYNKRLTKYELNLQKDKKKLEKTLDPVNRRTYNRRITKWESEIERHVRFLKNCPPFPKAA